MCCCSSCGRSLMCSPDSAATSSEGRCVAVVVGVVVVGSALTFSPSSLPTTGDIASLALTQEGPASSSSSSSTRLNKTW